MIATLIEQSKKLLELGLNPETADMRYEASYFSPSEDILEYKEEPIMGYQKGFTPCWSLGALLELMPNATLMMKDHEKGNDFTYCFCIAKHQEFISYDPLEAAYNMIICLLENGYIKKEKL